MKASNYGKAASGHKRFWVEMGTQPEAYCHGPFDDIEEAEAEARQMMDEDDRERATIGEGEEVELYLPDAEDIIERMTEGLYEQCGEAGCDYLDSRQVNKEQKAELNEVVEKAVAGWLTKHNLWPKFCKVDEVKVVNRETTKDSQPKPTEQTQ